MSPYWQLQRFEAWLDPPEHLAALGKNAEFPLDPDLWRDYELLVAFGIKPGEADHISALRLDWLLQMHWRVEKVRRQR